MTIDGWERLGEMAEPRGVQQVFVEKRERARHPWSRDGFMMFSMTGMEELERRLSDRTLGMQAVRVLITMARSCDFENECRMGRKDLANRLGMAESNVSKALKDLVACGFLERGPYQHSPYVISPKIAWKGSISSLKKALGERGVAA